MLKAAVTDAQHRPGFQLLKKESVGGNTGAGLARLRRMEEGAV
jgi:hypothetical protein